MTYQELMERHRAKDELSDLDASDRAYYEAFVRLGDTESDRRILADAWKRQHRFMNQKVGV